MFSNFDRQYQWISHFPIQYEAEIIWTPDHDSKDIDKEIDNMLERVCCTNLWLDGTLDTEFYLDYQQERGITADAVIDSWQGDGAA